MKKKFKFKKIFIILSITCTLLLSMILPTFAAIIPTYVDIDGSRYDVLYTHEYTYTQQVKSQFQFLGLVTMSDGFSGLFVNNNGFANAIINCLNGLDFKYLTKISYFNDSVTRLNSGDYFYFDDVVGPYLQVAHIHQFINQFNICIGGIDYNNRFQMGLNYTESLALFRYNNTFKDILFNCVNHWLADLIDNAVIPNANYMEQISNSSFGLINVDEFDTQSFDNFIGCSVQYKDGIVSIYYPILPSFSIRGAIKYLSKRTTWNFLPTAISSLVLQFVIVVAAVGTTSFIIKRI